MVSAAMVFEYLMLLLLFDHLSATAGVCAAAPPGFVYASAGLCCIAAAMFCI